jgi:hypothetical protein
MHMRSAPADLYRCSYVDETMLACTHAAGIGFPEPKSSGPFSIWESPPEIKRKDTHGWAP